MELYMLFGLLKSKEERFLDAAYHGNIEKVKHLLEKGVDIQYKDTLGINALKCAIWQNHKEIISFLLSQGIGIDMATVLGHTPLTKAISDGNIEIVRLLLEYGADSKLENGTSLTPLHYAKENEEMIALLKKYT